MHYLHHLNYFWFYTKYIVYSGFERNSFFKREKEIIKCYAFLKDRKIHLFKMSWNIWVILIETSNLQKSINNCILIFNQRSCRVPGIGAFLFSPTV